MATGKDKRYFDREFKYEAIRLMNEGKRSVRDIAKDLDIHRNVLQQWRRKYRADMEQAFPGKGHIENDYWADRLRRKPMAPARYSGLKA
jgi:transposase